MWLKEIEEWLEKTEKTWPPKKAEWIDSDEVQRFLSSYNRYRHGHWKGAKGEPGGVLRDISALRGLRKNVERHKDVAANDTIKESSIFESMEDPIAILQLHLLEKYRQAYRLFRTGSYRGAEGEISNLAAHFTRDQLRLLPVVGLAQYLGYTAKGTSPTESIPPKFHVHLGAGKLGLGLIARALVCGNTPFAIYQRISDEWNVVAKSNKQTIDVYINNERLTDFTIIRSFRDVQRLGFTKNTTETFTMEDCDQVDIDHFVQVINTCTESSYKRLLVLSDELGPFFARAADSLSCSIGPAVYPSLKQLWSHRFFSAKTSVVPPLYGCENDHSVFEKLKTEMEGQIVIKVCMVDRICSDRLISEDKVELCTEPYIGQIVVSPRETSSISCVFHGPGVLLPKTYASYCYLYNRKFLIVNGTHTTFAFITLRRKCIRSADAPGDFPLLRVGDMTPGELLEVKAWAVARCLLIFHNHDSYVIKHTHGLKTDDEAIECVWSYAQQMLQRLSSVQDSTKRVLGGGVANRYTTRLKDVLETLETFDKTLPFAPLFFKRTGFQSVEQLVQILRLLVLQTERFVTLCPPTKPDSDQTVNEVLHVHSKAHPGLASYAKGYYSQFSRQSHRS